jgi:hypothetical protein
LVKIFEEQFQEEKGEECDCKKDDYWDFIFKARQFVTKKKERVVGEIC